MLGTVLGPEMQRREMQSSEKDNIKWYICKMLWGHRKETLSQPGRWQTTVWKESRENSTRKGTE